MESDPAVPTLAGEIGLSVRQTQYYLAELEREGLIRRVTRLAGNGQTSNAYEFLWHLLLGNPVQETAPGGVQDLAPEGVQNLAPKESQIKESQEEEKRLRLSGHESQKRRFTPGLQAARCKQYPRLKEALADYMNEQGQERLYPSDRVVVDVVNAARATEEEVIECLRYLYSERGLRPGTRHGPRHFSWFRTAVKDYFDQKRARQLPPAAPSSGPFGNAGGLGKAAFNAMTEAIEI